MYKNFNITESEKEQILNRLKENGYRQPINEQSELSEYKLNDLSDDMYFARHGEDPLNEGKQVLINTFKKLIK